MLLNFGHPIFSNSIGNCACSSLRNNGTTAYETAKVPTSHHKATGGDAIIYWVSSCMPRIKSIPLTRSASPLERGSRLQCPLPLPTRITLRSIPDLHFCKFAAGDLGGDTPSRARSCNVAPARSSQGAGPVPAFLAMRSQSFSVCTRRFLASVWPLLKLSVRRLRSAKSGGGAASALSRSITSITT